MDNLVSRFYRMTDSAIAPSQQHDDDVGYDICVSEDYIITVGEFLILKTGLVVKPPKGYYFELAFRSSIPTKYGLLIPNGMGIIDPSYCGETDELGIQVYKFGRGSLDYWGAVDSISNEPTWVSHIKAGTRIAQLILRKTIYASFEEFSPDKTSRGGFGSTG